MGTAVDTHDTGRLDLQAYLQRIEYRGDLTPSPAVLEARHFSPGTRFAGRDSDG